MTLSLPCWLIGVEIDSVGCECSPRMAARPGELYSVSELASPVQGSGHSARQVCRCWLWISSWIGSMLMRVNFCMFSCVKGLERLL